ncbi:MAG: PorT family protein, partial [Longimicrobiales bacterium]|nr:PorT family protein [Longimicrobiales bacterium]
SLPDPGPIRSWSMRTTRLALAALTALLLPTVAPALAEAQEGLQLGFRGGVSVASASVHLQETFSKSNRTGFAGGIFLNYDASVFGFQIGGQYTQKGVDLDLGNVVNNFSLSYVEFPAVIKLGIPLGAIKPSVFGGAALGFKTGCDSNGNDCGDEFKGTDFLGIAGADLAIYLGSISLWMDGRYHFGLTNISKTGDVVGDLKNRNWTLQAGIGFKLGD